MTVAKQKQFFGILINNEEFSSLHSYVGYEKSRSCGYFWEIPNQHNSKHMRNRAVIVKCQLT